jgi:hypothetical protein
MAKKVMRFPETAEDWLARTDTKYLVCRGQRHDFPVLYPGRQLPKGIRPVPTVDEAGVRDGGFQLVFTCPRCGTERTRTTLPGGIYDFGIAFDYKHPKGYKSPPGSGVTRQDAFMETWRRAMEDGMFALPAGAANGHLPEARFVAGEVVD